MICVCGKNSSSLLRCSRCKCTFYCNKACQLQAWSSHKHLCSSISTRDESSQTLSRGFQALKQFYNHLLDPEKRKSPQNWFGDYIADNPYLVDSLLSHYGLSIQQQQKVLQDQSKYADIALETASRILSGVKARGAAEGSVMDEATEAILFPRIFAESFVKVYPGNSQPNSSLATPLDVRAKGNIVSGDTLTKIFSKNCKGSLQQGPYEIADADEWAQLIREDCIRYEEMRPDLFHPDMRLGGTKSNIRVTNKTHFGRWESSLNGSTIHCRVNVKTQWSWLDPLNLVDNGFLANEFPAIYDLVSRKLHSIPFELNRRVPDLKLATPRKNSVSFHVDTIDICVGPVTFMTKIENDHVQSCLRNDALVLELYPLLEKDAIFACKTLSVDARFNICAHYSLTSSSTSAMKNSTIEIKPTRFIYSIDEKDILNKEDCQDDNENAASGVDKTLFFYKCQSVLPSQALSLRLLSEEVKDTVTIQLFTIKYFMH